MTKALNATENIIVDIYGQACFALGHSDPGFNVAASNDLQIILVPEIWIILFCGSEGN
jgi:hypothetical protein